MGSSIGKKTFSFKQFFVLTAFVLTVFSFAFLFGACGKQEYTVTYVYGNGNANFTEKIFEGDKIKKPSTNPTRTGYLFKEWQDGGVPYNFSKKVTGDVILTAVWLEAVTVTFNSNGGSDVGIVLVAKGSNAIIPPAPTKTGYLFDCWLLNGVPYSFADDVVEDIILVARWTAKTYKVTLDANGGDSLTREYLTAVYNEPLDYFYIPPTHNDDGYYFNGFYYNDNGTHIRLIDENCLGIVNYNYLKDITLYVDWQPNAYEVLLDDNYIGGATILKTVRYNENYSFVIPSRNGNYAFDGYFENSDGTGRQFTDEFGNSLIYQPWDLKQPTIIYASWVTTCEVTFELNGGELSGGQSAVTLKNKADTVFPVPVKEGYNFLGYYTSSNVNALQLVDRNGELRKDNVLENDTITVYAKYAEDNIVLIETADDLELVRTNLGGSFLLLNNIDLNNSQWQMFGGEFTGIFDGNGYIISNFRIINIDNYLVGFFMFNTGVIKNFGLKDFKITSDFAGANTRVGGLVGHNTGTSGSIINCFVYNAEIIISKTTAGDIDAGMLVGVNNAVVSSCYAEGGTLKVTSKNKIKAGGLVGDNVNGEIVECYSGGGNINITISSGETKNMFVGGLCGSATDSTITNSFAFNKNYILASDDISQVSLGAIAGVAAESESGTNYITPSNLSFNGGNIAADTLMTDFGTATKQTAAEFFSSRDNVLFVDVAWDFTKLSSLALPTLFIFNKI